MTTLSPESPGASPPGATVLTDHGALLSFLRQVFTGRGVPPGRAAEAARALCHGDLTGMDSHGVANLARLYLPLLDEGRADPRAEPRILADLGAAVLLDADRSLGLWAAPEAMDLAVRRAESHGVGLVSVRGATHLGCAGHPALRAAERGLVGVVASNCGGQRIARPPGGAVTMLGTNPLAVAAPAGAHPPFLLDMSTTAAPTGRVRQAAREGRSLPEGLLCDDSGSPVTDPAEFDAGRAHLRWLGGEVGRFKGFGLGLMVEVLSAVVSGSGRGPHADALAGDGGPGGRDDDIGFLLLAIAPDALRAGARADAEDLFGAVAACPPLDRDRPVRYPGWHEHHRMRERSARGVPLAADLYAELVEVAAREGVPAPPVSGEVR
ncbi:malate dehydrogenase [Nocardiopsis terrae]|uniref:LDH2 family malate/lactate/ureidoglycolate dehydrogenase n=1 Tax=Nocardiopsis terrae TaxID=372655 RepID=A0ABR9HGL2_9ACTN|nr:Ldh family oxidoreductase [Nocardiopsis terrae]MBE1458102.1 LDH2 family malate/lactate/ureidoglycolate dehydrogenase [Nocardiopsis terrae]GHC82183.1 malate dehydrogenase [Nocardiopsis terrae]